MNRIDKLPKPFKDRVFLDCIEFSGIQDNAVKNTILRRYLTTQNTTIEEQVTDEFLNEQLQKIGSCTGRNLKKVSSVICRINRRNEATDSPVMVIKKQSIEQAFAEYISWKQKIKYDFEEETDEERQNRFHIENMTMQRENFIQQQLIQVAISSNQKTIVGEYSGQLYSEGATISEKGKREIDALITDEQRETLERMIVNTQIRKALEKYRVSRAGKIWRKS